MIPNSGLWKFQPGHIKNGWYLLLRRTIR